MRLETGYPVMQAPAVSESWDLSPSVVPPRSRLYSLDPIGIGTAFVESLTGYIARLAEAHAVSVGDLVGPKLLREIAKGPPLFPQQGRPHRTPRHGYQAMSYTLNRATETSRKWIDALETATLCQDLSALTLLSLEGVVTQQFLLRRVRAWCPRCYEERRSVNSAVYDPLLWAIRVVTVCPRHQQPLEHTCPHCSRWQHPLAAYSYPGHCSRCRHWLGLQEGANGSDGEPRQGQAGYPLWVANAVGELLAAAPRLPPQVLKDNVRHNLWSYVDRLGEGNQDAFAHLVQSPRDVIRSWLTGQSLPRVDALLRVCYHLGISMIALVTSGAADAGVDWELRKLALSGPNGGRVRRHHPDKLRRVLEAALHEEPAPSVSEIARRRGYSAKARLYQVDRDLCKRITANHRRGRVKCSHWWKRRGTERICDAATIKQSLEQALAQAQPISVHRLAESLGYAGDCVLRQEFPDLCRAIVAKRAARNKTRLNGDGLALRTALKEDPPPSLRELGGRLGRSPRSLQQYFPGLCVALQSRHKKFRVRCTAKLRKRVQALLSENPPPSVNKACQRVGLSCKGFCDKFPDLANAIGARYLRHRAEAAQKRRELLREEMRHIVLQLHRQAILPSWSRVTALLTKDSLKDWDLRAKYLKEARQELELNSNH